MPLLAVPINEQLPASVDGNSTCSFDVFSSRTFFSNAERFGSSTSLGKGCNDQHETTHQPSHCPISHPSVAPAERLGDCWLDSSICWGEEPTALHILRVNTIPLNHYLPFSPRTITDPHAVQRLYDAAHALPRLSLPSIINCPLDLGLDYHLIFSQGHTIKQEMIVYPEGCRRLQIGESDLRVLTEPFVHLFVQTIGITEPELAPQPLYSYTPKSPCPSPTSTH